MRELQRRLPQLHGLFYYDAQGKWIATSAVQIPAGINNSDCEYSVYQRNSIHPGPVIRNRSASSDRYPLIMAAGAGRGAQLCAGCHHCGTGGLRYASGASQPAR